MTISAEQMDQQIADYSVKSIGRINTGSFGSDEFVLVKRLDDAIDIEGVQEYLLGHCYCEGSSAAGSYFCHTVEVLLRNDNEAVAVIHHRYDV